MKAHRLAGRCTRVLACAGFALSLVACGGGGTATGGNGPQVPGLPAPTGTPANSAPASRTQTVTLGLAQTVTFAPIASGAAGSITFAATTSGRGPAEIRLQSVLPSGVPAPQSVLRSPAATHAPNVLGGAVTPLAYIVLKPSAAVSFRATPGVKFTFSAGAASGYAYLAYFDPANPALGWKSIAGPGQTAVDGSITLASTAAFTPPLALAANDPYVFAVVTSGTTLPTPSPAPYSITEYAVPGPYSYIRPITAGPDGNLWFYQLNGPSEGAGKITTSGQVTRFPFKAPPFRSPASMTAGPDGNVWFTESANSSIGKIAPSGALTEYPLPTTGSNPWGITTGPDGNLWFTESDLAIPGGGYGGIGKITPSGVVTDYPLPIPPGTSPDSFAPAPLDIARVGNYLWFVELGGAIGKISTSGAITVYPLPVDAAPAGITAGPDGNAWFVDSTAFSIGKITPNGTVTEYFVANGTNLQEIVAGPDGNLWVTDTVDNIFKVTPAGKATRFPTPTQPSVPLDITVGPDGNIWFTESGASQIGRLLLP